MKRIGHIRGSVWLPLLALLAAGCTGSDPLPSPGIEPGANEEVPVTLRAGSHRERTRAAIDEGDTFKPLLLCSHKENDYTSIAWKREVTVATDGTVVYPDATPLYPHYGAFVYLTGLHPIPANAGRIVKGLVTWTLDGTTDLMYAPQLAGNRWDGFRIHGNTDPKLDKTLEFNHQLTQLRFCAVRKANTVESNEFRVTRITLKAVPAKASFTVAGVAEKDLAVDFTEPGDLAAVLYMDKANPSKTVLVTSTDADNPDAVGYVLLPAAAKYTADIETTLGTFLSREVKSADGPFTKGYANQITLHLSEDGLSITGVQLEDWTDEDGGEVNVN